jgi:hypothetical protein
VGLPPRVVVVHRRTEYEELIARHSTRQQVGFFLAQRDRALGEVEQRHTAQQAAAQRVFAAIPLDWRRGEVERSDLNRFVFGPEDVIVAVGQDGLVANVAKYLTGQIVVGINPEPDRNPGVLVRHAPAEIEALLPLRRADGGHRRPVTVMVSPPRRRTDPQRTQRGVHRPPFAPVARYVLQTPKGVTERHSSWRARRHRNRCHRVVPVGVAGTQEPVQCPTDQAKLCWFVREAWPSRHRQQAHPGVVP